MNLANLERWQVFQRRLGGPDASPVYEYIRIVGIGRVEANVVLIAVLNLTAEARVPDVCEADEFQRNIEKGWTRSDDHPFRPEIRSWDDVPSEFVEDRKMQTEARVKIIKTLDGEGFKLFFPDTRARLIEQVCEKADGSFHSKAWVRKLLAAWWRFGGNAFGLMPAHHRCGAKSRADLIHRAKAEGREVVFPRSFPKRAKSREEQKKPGCEITPPIYELVVETLEKLVKDEDKRAGVAFDVKRRKGLPWAIFHREVKKAMHLKFAPTSHGANGQLTRHDLEAWQMPNRYQVRHIGRKVLNVPDTLRVVFGNRVFNLQHREIVGDFRDLATCHGRVYQIDSYELDVHAVHDITLLPIGRLFAYFIVDVFSKAIVGVYVTCGEPSYRQAVHALNAAFMRKSDWGKLIGLDIKDEDWPMCGLADSLLADNGELARYASDVLPEMGVIDLANTPPYRGDLKAQVEQCFEMSDYGLIRLLPGATMGPRQRCTEAPQKRAKMTMRQLTHLLTRWAYEVHNRRDLSERFVSPQWVRDWVKTTPNGIWEYSVTKLRGTLPAYDARAYLPRMLERTVANITDAGLLVGDLLFDRPDDPAFRAEGRRYDSLRLQAQGDCSL